MRKNTFLAALAIAAAMCSCTKKELPTDKENLPEEEMQTIYARVNIATKVAYSEVNEGGGAGLTSVWSEGDHFYAIQDGSTVVQFTLSSGAGKTNAIFKARAAGVTDATTWTGVLGNAAKASGSEIHCDYNGQGGTLASLSAYNFVKADAEGTEPTFDFENGEKLSYILRIALPAGIKCIEYTPSAWQKVTSSGTSVSRYNSDEQNDFGPDRTSTITLGSLSSKGDFAYIAFPAIDFSTEYQVWNGKQNGNYRTGIVITLLNDTSDNADLSTGWVLGAHREGGDLSEKGGLIRTMDMSDFTMYKRPKPSEAITINTTNVSCTLHQNLTQATSSMSTGWAPFNLGASKVSEAGLYLAYGEYWDNENYGWGAYLQRHKPNGSYYEDIMTPTTPAIGNGQNNYYSIAGSRYDAARVLWGSAWRMPHAVEIKGLGNSKTYTTIDGVNCAIYTVNGSAVRFPATGYYMRTDDSDSKSIVKKDAGYAYIRSADKLQRTQTSSNTIYRECYSYWMGATAAATTSDPDNFTRSLGFRGYPVRPVLASSTIVAAQ